MQICGLAQYFCNLAGSYSASAFAYGKLESFFHGYGVNEFSDYFGVVPWHNHFLAFWEVYGTRNVGGAEIELGSVAGKEGAVTSAFRL